MTTSDGTTRLHRTGGPLARLMPRRLIDQVALVVMSLVLALILVIGVFFLNMLHGVVKEQTGIRALQLARQVAARPDVVYAIQYPYSSDLAQLADAIRYDTAATAVTIAPLPAPQSLEATSPGLDAARRGHPYLEDAPGAIRAYAPVLNRQNTSIGAMSIEFEVDSLSELTGDYRELAIAWLYCFVIVGLIASMLIARGVKKAIFGLEPREIASMLQEKEAIIQSIREGVVATDSEGRISMINPAAIEQLEIANPQLALGQALSQSLPENLLKPVLVDGKPLLNLELVVSGKELILNLLPIQHGTEGRGVVATFRTKDELDLVSRELSQANAYSELLRAQTHEYANRLHTIAGMIQIGDYDEVLSFIQQEGADQKKFIRTLMSTVADPTLLSLLLGKYMYAKESNLRFAIDPESGIGLLPRHISRKQVVTILGNLLQNAFEACLGHQGTGEVSLFMTDLGNDLIFEVDDSGPGLSPELQEKVFAKGVSTKAGQGRGFGLYLVRQTLAALGGSISVGTSDLGGASFLVTIPKPQEDIHATD